ncbi:MAG: hypothetical protein RBU30_14515, partial [Polyangia bacterium]|nr:hypothetical protein [Polyangia bacterium]
GVPGFVLGLWLLVRAMRRRPDEASPRGPPLGSLVAILAVGLSSSPCFFAPTLALGAVCLGVRLGPPPHSATQLGKLLPPIALALALLPLTQRLRSELDRSEATKLRLANRPEAALARAREATRIDNRNPRAWIEAALALEARGKLELALEAWSRALVDLPTDAVRQRHHALAPKGAAPRSDPSDDGRPRPTRVSPPP